MREGEGGGERERAPSLLGPSLCAGGAIRAHTHARSPGMHARTHARTYARTHANARTRAHTGPGWAGTVRNTTVKAGADLTPGSWFGQDRCSRPEQAELKEIGKLSEEQACSTACSRGVRLRQSWAELSAPSGPTHRPTHPVHTLSRTLQERSLRGYARAGQPLTFQVPPRRRAMQHRRRGGTARALGSPDPSLAHGAHRVEAWQRAEAAFPLGRARPSISAMCVECSHGAPRHTDLSNPAG
jgi:hypothetical protein